MPRFGRFDTAPKTIGNPINVSPDLRRPMPVHEDYGAGFSPGTHPTPPEAINHFLADFGNKAIRNGAAGNTNFQKASDQFTDMFTGWTATVNYTRNHGQENMHVAYKYDQKHIIVPDVRKKKSEEEIQRTQLEDIMLDGYACILLEWGSSIPTTPQNSNFEVYFNGTSLGTMAPVQLGVESAFMIVLTFGKSLFRAHSYIDKINPAKLLNPIIPPRSDKLLPAYSPVAFQHNTNQSASVFWDNAIWNAGMIDERGFTTIGYPFYNTYMFGNQAGNFQVKKFVQIDYPDIKSSPLHLNGLNEFKAIAIAADPVERVTTFQVFAEFFDRKELRQVQQSWRYPYVDNQDVVVNDKPRYWAATIQATGVPCSLFDPSSKYNTGLFEIIFPKGISPPNPKDCIP